jgi:hypothetical protein
MKLTIDLGEPIRQLLGQTQAAQFKVLHSALDTALAAYLKEHPKKVPSQTSVAALLNWLKERADAEER